MFERVWGRVEGVGVLFMWFSLHFDVLDLPTLMKHNSTWELHQNGLE